MKKVEVDVGVEWLVIYMAAHGMDVWAVGGGLTSGSTVAGTGTGLGPWMQGSSLKESG